MSKKLQLDDYVNRIFESRRDSKDSPGDKKQHHRPSLSLTQHFSEQRKRKLNVFHVPIIKQVENGVESNIETIPNGNEETDEEHKFPGPSNPKPPEKFGHLKPVFLNEHQRTYANPISYLGGPQLPARNRWSIESVMSLD